MFACFGSLEGDADDVAVADEGELHWFTHFAGEGIVNAARPEGTRVRAVDEQDFVADANAGLRRSEIPGNFANIQALVRPLREHRSNRAARGAAAEQTPHHQYCQTETRTRSHDR